MAPLVPACGRAASSWVSLLAALLGATFSQPVHLSARFLICWHRAALIAAVSQHSWAQPPLAGVDTLPAELEGQLESELLTAPFFIEAAIILPAHKALLLADTGE